MVQCTPLLWLMVQCTLLLRPTVRCALLLRPMVQCAPLAARAQPMHPTLAQLWGCCRAARMHLQAHHCLQRHVLCPISSRPLKHNCRAKLHQKHCPVGAGMAWRQRRTPAWGICFLARAPGGSGGCASLGGPWPGALGWVRVRQRPQPHTFRWKGVRFRKIRHWEPDLSYRSCSCLCRNDPTLMCWKGWGQDRGVTCSVHARSATLTSAWWVKGCTAVLAQRGQLSPLLREWSAAHLCLPS